METFSALLALCAGNSPVTGGFSSQRAIDAELWGFLWSVPWKSGWVNNREAGDLSRHRAHYDVIEMKYTCPKPHNSPLRNRNVHISVPVWCIVGYGTGYCGICEIGLLECFHRKPVDTQCILHCAGLFINNSRTLHFICQLIHSNLLTSSVVISSRQHNDIIWVNDNFLLWSRTGTRVNKILNDMLRVLIIRDNQHLSLETITCI